MTPWFSLILPCYNVEQYVERCVQSIIAQDYTDYEIILVDDGSTDQTPMICDALAEKYSFIRVIHKENGGLSSARNAGIDDAMGEYIWFIDSDDWIEPGALKQLFYSSSNGRPDIVKFAHYRIESQKEFVPHNVEPGLYQGNAGIEYLLRKGLSAAGHYCLSAWSHLYRRDFILLNQLRFVLERWIGSEDYLFNIQALFHVSCLQVISKALYNYEMRPGSLTQTYKGDLMNRYGTLYQELRKYHKSVEENQTIQRLIDRFFVWHLAIGTSLLQEYSRIKVGADVRRIRRNAREILKRNDVQTAAKNSDRLGLGLRKNVQLWAIRCQAEWLFYWLYVIKPGIKRK